MPIPGCRTRTLLTLLLAAICLCTPSLFAQQEDPGWAPPDQNPWNAMDYGPFLTHTVAAQLPAGNFAAKGIAIRLGKPGGPRAAILFDTELCRVAAGWTGGFLHLNGYAFDGSLAANPSIRGTQLFGTKILPGWASPDARMDDPRPRTKDAGADLAYGPIPRDWARYRGLYVHGDQVILRYAVGDNVDVIELPGVERIGDVTVITRTIKVAGHARELLLRIAEVMGTDLSVKLTGIPVGMDAAIEGRDGALFLRLPARAEPTLLKLFIGVGVKGEAPADPFVDPETLTKGGPARWPQTVETKGVVAPVNDDVAYVVDTLAVPESNPFKSWLRFTAIDFPEDGGKTTALATLSGDVWMCSGLDDPTLGKLTWRRFASGLFQPLGLKVVDGKVCVLGRDGITRLHDLNGDGEADFYENVNNDVAATPSTREFAVDLQTDPAGNFYFAKAGPIRADGVGFDARTPHHGTLIRVSEDGGKLDVVATGLRSPGGVGVGPGGQITVSDLTTTAALAFNRLNWVESGGFYGTAELAQREPVPATPDNPLCWLPVSVDAAPGGQVWVTSGQWGPLSGRLLHFSGSPAALFLVPFDDSTSEVQGGVVRFPLAFESAISRGRFNPADGQLYVTGFKPPGSAAAIKETTLQRVRYTGKPVTMPAGLKVADGRIELTFTEPIDKAAAGQGMRFGVEQVVSKDASRFLEVRSATVAQDNKTVRLEVPAVQPATQLKLSARVRSADGSEREWTIHATLNHLGASPTSHPTSNPATEVIADDNK